MDTDTAESLSMSVRNGPEGTPATDSIVLEEEIDPNYVPSEEEGISLVYSLSRTQCTAKI
jgi:hypothetical protein